MGDRANVIVREGDEQVCLYTHGRGSELPKILQSAMQRGKERWRDAPYLARIIFCEMVKGRESTLTGFGISVTPQDGENRVIMVDTDEQAVRVQRGRPIPFADFADSGADWGA